MAGSGEGDILPMLTLPVQRGLSNLTMVDSWLLSFDLSALV